MESKVKTVTATLDDFYVQMREGKITKRKLEDEIYRFFLRDNRIGERLRKTSAEFCDFLCSIYPKISKAIDKYKNKGSTLEAYITVIIFYSYKEEKLKEYKRKFIDNLCFQENQRDLLVSETEESYEGFNHPPGAHTANSKNCVSIRTLYVNPLYSNTVMIQKNPWLKLIIIMLKSYTVIEQCHIEKIAKITGISCDDLLILLDRIKTVRFDADRKLSELKYRVHTQYYRCLSYETRLKHIAVEDIKYKKMVTQLNRAKETLIKMRCRLRRKRVDATNKQVADVLGIPKGSVDFCVSHIRSQLRGDSKEFSKNDLSFEPDTPIEKE